MQGLGAKIDQNDKFAKFSCRENFMLYGIYVKCSLCKSATPSQLGLSILHKNQQTFPFADSCTMTANFMMNR